VDVAHLSIPHLGSPLAASSYMLPVPQTLGCGGSTPWTHRSACGWPTWTRTISKRLRL